MHTRIKGPIEPPSKRRMAALSKEFQETGELKSSTPEEHEYMLRLMEYLVKWHKPTKKS